ncbi:hypothetical protein ANANG_G00267460 [Anguilla anguilla]|uniref:Uncharacterized protein n=1 Tax=Anguilla anguilla TaxID=7936 RepID=A0A9D3LSU8_ANGAN|nr:hypothetical protein ANANG_G00267460 [Anguilla anguilla]
MRPVFRQQFDTGAHYPVTSPSEAYIQRQWQTTRSPPAPARTHAIRSPPCVSGLSRQRVSERGVLGHGVQRACRAEPGDAEGGALTPGHSALGPLDRV